MKNNLSLAKHYRSHYLGNITRMLAWHLTHALRLHLSCVEFRNSFLLTLFLEQTLEILNIYVNVNT